MRLSVLALLLTASTSALAVGCAGQTEDADGDGVSTEAVTAAKLTPGTFKLYGTPGRVPNATCDHYAKLELSNSPSATATIEAAVSGACDEHVDPDRKTFRLSLAKTECGSRIYQATNFPPGGGLGYSYTITDHRKRTCENVIEALVIFEESVVNFAGVHHSTLYSYDGQPAPAPASVTLEGTLAQTMGAGGENTGVSIRTATELVELILDPSEREQFRSGRKARAKGEIKLLSGVETHDRKALDVKEFLVCPAPRTTVNCMPGPFRSSSLCAGEDHRWVGANCPDVHFSY